jgi:hypothetical protein
MAGTSSGSRFTLFVDCLLFLYTISPYPLHRCVPINSDGEQCPLIPMVIQVATDTPLSRRTNVIYLSCTGTPLSTRVKSRFVGVMPRPQTPIITNLLDLASPPWTIRPRRKNARSTPPSQGLDALGQTRPN